MKSLFKHNLPRWIIFFIDVTMCCGSIIFAYLLRFNFHIPVVEISTWYFVFPFVIAVRALSFLIFKTFSGIIRYTSTRDAMRILITLLAGMIFMALSNFISYQFTYKYVVPFSILIIDFLISVFLMIAGRLAVKVAYSEISNPSKEKDYVIIYGAGKSGLITKRTIDEDVTSKYKVLAFIDDEKKLTNKKLEGIDICGADELEHLLTTNQVKQVIIAIQNLNSKRKAEIIETCLKFNTNVLSVPAVSNWINGELSFRQIKNVKIEDLLQRDPIQLDQDKIHNMLTGKIILITGAAGSIGSEIVRQLIQFKPATIALVDMAESALYEIEFTLNQLTLESKIEIIIADIRNQHSMHSVFNRIHPDIVYHAAAYKHVPMMELHPQEAVQTNVLGSKILADLAHEFKVDKFVMVSTDKAVNPTNIMGASKRIAEIYIQSFSTISKTKFITTRFGNVLGSNGSVIPIFKKQIEEGKALTVTHPDMTRYFMTIPEACQLVIEAGAIGNGGEIFIFDMGIPIKIADLAKKMIQLSGLQLGKDIQIVYSGLRPGEKLFEELLNDKENTLPTHHNKIMIAKIAGQDYQSVTTNLTQLVDLINSNDKLKLVKKMKEIVPEFISNNSEFEKLDVN